MILQAAVGVDGAWEFWMAVTEANREHCSRLVAKAPARWRIVRG